MAKRVATRVAEARAAEEAVANDACRFFAALTEGLAAPVSRECLADHDAITGDMERRGHVARFCPTAQLRRATAAYTALWTFTGFD